jgi:hypothetical protein
MGIKVIPRMEAAFYEASGAFVAMFLTDVWGEQEQEARAFAYSRVNGDLRNRPEIIGKGARQPLPKKDGSFTDYVGTHPEVLEDSGVADMFGFYRYQNSSPGVVDCGLTGPTVADLEHYVDHILPIEKMVTLIYAAHLPEQFAEQMKYIDSIMPEWKNEASAFTTSYGLKDQPCAIHTDSFDIPTAPGVITTTGCFGGNELAMPEFGIAFDVQPSDILFLDVHRRHGNFPRTWGSRTSQVFFVRKGMHECK